MQFLSNLKLSRVIVILVAMPIIAMSYFASQLVLNEMTKKTAMDDLGQITYLAVDLSDLVHEQQKERGASAVYIASKGREFSDNLASQRLLTDSAKSKLKSYLTQITPDNYGSKFVYTLDNLLISLNEMESIRSEVDNLSISGADAVEYYTTLNDDSIHFIDFIGQLSVDHHITSEFIGYTSFLNSKERAGIERAIGASGLSAGSLNDEMVDKFKRVITIQDTYNRVFLSGADIAEEKQFDELVAADAAREVENMRQVILKGAANGEFGNLTSELWFDQMTLKINELKGFENALTESLLVDIEELEQQANDGLWNASVAAGLCLLLIMSLSFIISSSITRSFKMIVARMNALADGDLEVELPEAANNEIGQMITCIEVFKNNAIEKVQLETKQADDKLKSEAEKQELMTQMADDFDHDVGGIVDAVSKASITLQQTAESMSDISETTNKNANIVAEASDVANINVQAVAAASEEMSQSVIEITEQVHNASAASKSAVVKVNKTSEEMKNLAKTVEEIGSVAQLIATIADQTNMLALNATIESARAGEAGRGFAVVASEVKALASKTAQATDEISQHIGDVQAATEQAIHSMDGIRSVIDTVDETSTSIAAAVEQQSVATQEISRSAQEAASGTQKVSANIGEVTTASKQTDNASNDVMKSATELLAQSNTLKTELKNFTEQVRVTG